MNPHLRRWLHISLFNLLLVAFAGVVLRYKIAFSLPFINQKYLMNGHSHFAFAGWVTQALMALLVAYLQDRQAGNAFRKYRGLLYANLITAYGMLFSFPVQGYAPVSIFFSTASIVVSYAFAVLYWKDLRRLPQTGPCRAWFRAAVVFNALSSLGPFSLAYMMAAKNIHTEPYLLSIYFFLHFQYNGWFFFACMGLLVWQLSKYGAPANRLRLIFRLFLAACVPAYLLSALWLPLPGWIYAIVVIAAFLQIAGWWLLLGVIKNRWRQLKGEFSPLMKRLFRLWALALTIKLCLQAGSVIPSLSRLAFGFRPIVIGYLHLVLLGVITLFIFAYVISQRYISMNRPTVSGINVFVAGIILNETLLMLQGLAYMQYVALPFINQSLLLAALVLFAGMLLINYGQKKHNMSRVTNLAVPAYEL